MFETPIMKWYELNHITALQIPLDTELMFITEGGPIYTGKLMPSGWHGYCSTGLSKIDNPVTHFAMMPARPMGEETPSKKTPAETLSKKQACIVLLNGMMSGGYPGTTRSRVVDAIEMYDELVLQLAK